MYDAEEMDTNIILPERIYVHMYRKKKPSGYVLETVVVYNLPSLRSHVRIEANINPFLHGD